MCVSHPSFWTLFSLVTLEKALGMSAILTKYGCIRRTTWALQHMVSVSNCVNVNNDRRCYGSGLMQITDLRDFILRHVLQEDSTELVRLKETHSRNVSSRRNEYVIVT